MKAQGPGQPTSGASNHRNQGRRTSEVTPSDPQRPLKSNKDPFYFSRYLLLRLQFSHQ